MSHTPEPWSYELDHGSFLRIYSETNSNIVYGCGCCGSPNCEDADARRIVACINACAGMNTESLESIAGRIAAKSVLQMHENYIRNKAKAQSLEQQRDDLLAALTEIAELDILKYHHAYAIAKGAIEEIEALK